MSYDPTEHMAQVLRMTGKALSKGLPDTPPDTSQDPIPIRNADLPMLKRELAQRLIDDDWVEGNRRFAFGLVWLDDILRWILREFYKVTEISREEE